MEEDKTITIRQNIKRIFPYLKKYKKWLYYLWVTSIFAGVMNFIHPFLIQTLTDAALAKKETTLNTFILITIFVIIFDVLNNYFGRIVAIRYEVLTIQNIKNEIVGRIQLLPISFINTFHSGDLISRLNNDIEKISIIPKRINELVNQPLTFIFGFIYLYTISWKLLLATCILIPLSAILFDKVVKPMQAHSRKEMTHMAQANAVTQDAISGIIIIKAFNLQKYLSKKFQRIAEMVRDEGLAIDKRAAIELAIFLMLRYIPQLVAPLYGGYLAFIGEISVGGLIASTYLIWLLFMPVETMLDWIRQLREISPAIERIFMILDHPIENQISDKEISIGNDSKIIFDSVDFQYGEDMMVLQDFNLTIEDSKIVALVGSSGCGKSTVLKILCGFYEPQTGRVSIGGNDIFKSNIKNIRKEISLVTQETYLYPTTILENIGYGRIGATREEIISAAKAANAHEFIMSKPEEYETLVGEWGAKLSGGERQRIALSRAILKDAPILLLDEPTSALDIQTESIVQEALERFMKNRTVLVIAHRLSTIKNVDEIIVLKEGRIIERGTHNQLLQSDTQYKQLYINQLEKKGQND